MEQETNCLCVELFCVSHNYELIKVCESDDKPGTEILVTCLDCGGEAFEYSTTTDETIDQAVYRIKQNKNVLSSNPFGE